MTAERRGKTVEYRGRIVIGADGVSSAVSRAIGNTLKDGVMAVSLRAYFRDCRCDGARMKVYFDRDYFPGYGWLFVDDEGFANIGLGCLKDRRFPLRHNLGASFRRFIAEDLAEMLADATQCGPFSGGSSGFFRPRSISAARVMLIGDAANQADPLNGGGIHKAMESAWCAAEACRVALADGDFSAASMRRYADLWSRQWEADWRTAELFMSIAKNPSLSDFGLFVLRHMGRLSMSDPKFREFAGGDLRRHRFPGCLAGGPRPLSRLPQGPRGLARPVARERTGSRGRDRRRDLQPRRLATWPTPPVRPSAWPRIPSPTWIGASTWRPRRPGSRRTAWPAGPSREESGHDRP